MFYRNLLLIGIAWALGNWGGRLIPRSPQITYDHIGDYFTLLLMGPFYVIGFLVVFVGGILLLRFILIDQWDNLKKKNFHSQHGRMIHVILILLALFALSTFFLHGLVITSTIVGIAMLYDLRRWSSARKNRMKMMQLFDRIPYS